jgi:hypothetical protein
MNAFAERWVQSVKRECVSRMRPAHRWRGPCRRESQRAASQLSTRGLTALLLRDRLVVDIVHNHRSAYTAEVRGRESAIRAIGARDSGGISAGRVSGQHGVGPVSGYHEGPWQQPQAPVQVSLRGTGNRYQPALGMPGKHQRAPHHSLPNLTLLNSRRPTLQSLWLLGSNMLRLASHPAQRQPERRLAQIQMRPPDTRRALQLGTRPR